MLQLSQHRTVICSQILEQMTVLNLSRHAGQRRQSLQKKPEADGSAAQDLCWLCRSHTSLDTSS